SVLFKNPLVGNEYQIIIRSFESGDELIIKVESSQKLSESEKMMLMRELQYDLKETILVTPKIEVVDPASLPRSEGKSKRIIYEKVNG
ncbi:MAG: phenylacetate--CoA ligase family protein, partial [Ignisphaera sp.]|nr:phenylacetate--CoA ligase family protein [Ignisphaera sp.]MDW8086258.1 phenylacetate--CoA ligase family protein [Ignisphaera sp.]